MTHSKRKHPIIGITTCDSEKREKVAAHRRLRRLVRERTNQVYRLHYTDYWLSAEFYNPLHIDDGLMPHYREISDPYWWGKDGKHRVRDDVFADHPWHLWMK